MKVIYLLPFTYFYDTRLRHNSLAFHAIFEWLAAVVLVFAVGHAGHSQALIIAGLSYLAFISLYEIGYIVNDLFSSKREEGGRLRGPQGVSCVWVVAWFVTRLISFLLITIIGGKLLSPEWWSFFASLCVVFSVHNRLTDPEFKTITFLWLAWLRFMAPLIFVIHEAQLFGVGLAAAMTYVSFRLLGYLDGKGLLKMPSRKNSNFRLFFFMMPLIATLIMWYYEGARGFITLIFYYAVVSALGTFIVLIRSFNANKG